MLGKNLTEYRRIAVMSQGQFSKRIFGEPGDGDGDAQLLSKFSSKCRARHFPGLHVPTGQVPDVGIPTAPGRSVTEQNPVAVPQQRRDDASLRRAFRGDRHGRILPPLVSRHCAVPERWSAY